MRRSRIAWLGPISVSFVPGLRSSRRRLYSGGAVGQEVHAASALPQRRIVFDAALLDNAAELRRIATHELFHFAWVRLGNPWRRSWELLLTAECQTGARGELGWSAELRKRELQTRDWRTRTTAWRAYACESFCDTAAWLLTGARPHTEATLGRQRQGRRAQWFAVLFRDRGVSI